ncbi:IucA/IucC family C-terminal-domain containing protein [Paenibacillus caui]|uniref:IucA/IucC family C-terminal-domain containing protein n=1 Tax=Paenibacillus caui TaxID=2873927 RepID=UPI001CA7F734|nr:IucA/IucC family C-terminal-domain containing protein [Paenibacillus caui]
MSINFELFDQYLCLVRCDPGGSAYSVNAKELLQPEAMETFLEAFRLQIKGTDVQVAGTYFAAWWRGVCVALQYMISLTDRMLDLSLDNIKLHLAFRDKYPKIVFRLAGPEELPWPAGSHEEKRAAVLEHFYAGQLRPLFQTLAASTGLSLGQLWGQLPLGIEYYMKLIEGMLESEGDKLRLREDHRFLAESLDPALFGLKRNPFTYKKVMIDDPREPGKQLVMKPTCCLAYRTDTGYGCCITCPKLTEEQRAQKFADMAKPST